MVVRWVLAAWEVGASISVLLSLTFGMATRDNRVRSTSAAGIAGATRDNRVRYITVLGGIFVILVVVVVGDGGVVRAIVVVATVVGVDEDWIVKEVLVDQVLIGLGLHISQIARDVASPGQT